MPEVLVDLTFRDPELETAWRLHRLDLVAAQERRVEGARLTIWVVILLKQVVAANAKSALLAAAGVAGGVTTQLCLSSGKNLRLRYAAAILCNLLSLTAVCTIFGDLFADEPTNYSTAASHLRALAITTSGNGVPFIFFFVSVTPLPFSLLFPMLAAMAAILLAHTGTICATPDFQHGYSVVDWGLRHALLVARQRAPGTPYADEAVQCGRYQRLVVLIGFLWLGFVVFAAEMHQRRSFLWGRPGAAAQAALRHCKRLAAGDFFLNFGVPASCCLYIYFVA